MSSFRAEVPHCLGKDAAKQRLQTFIDKISQQFQEQVTHLQRDWQDHTLHFSLTTYGMNVTGTLTVENDLARIEGKLPLAAMMFRGKIEKTVVGELERELA
jgi:hypothetical protein